MQMLYLLLLNLLFIPEAHSSIFRCETRSGAIYYNERACEAGDFENEIINEKTQLCPKEIALLERNLKQQRNKLHKQTLQRQKQKLVAYKKNIAAKKRRLRNKTKCDTVKSNINAIMQRYKAGYSVKQGIMLDRKLAKYKEHRQMYCNHEQIK